MASGNGKEVVLVSDDQMIGKLLNILLKSQGMLPKLENNISKGIEYVKIRKRETSLFIFDLNVLSEEGLRALDAIQQFDANDDVPPRIILSNCDIDCEDCGVPVSENCFHFKKPFSMQQLLEKIKEIVA